jgi:hypothetical protein
MTEVLVAVLVFALGIVPVFLLLTQSRKTTTVSLTEMQATIMISSMINGLKAAPIDDLRPIFDRDLEDHQFPARLALPRLGIGPGHPTLKRRTRLRLVNLPTLPGERFSNPWGAVLELSVTVLPAQPTPGPGPAKPVLIMKGYRHLGGQQ